ncbi:MAG: cellulase family glycosylhydrolase [Anaerolineales bacterium]|nr:cellulase family glycosylhydrolase [Anaerolineales bacterium]
MKKNALFLSLALVGLLLVWHMRAAAAPSTSATTFLPVVSHIFRGYVAPTIFGVQMYGPTGSAQEYHDQLLQSNATWIRVPVEWNTVEPSDLDPQNYHWNNVDQILKAATEGFTLIVTLSGNPSWAATFPNGRIDLVPMTEYEEFLNAIVERYDGDGYNDAPGSPVVNYWEIFNEPDAGDSIPNDVRWGNYGGDYADLLQHAYTVIKDANPSAVVVFGGIAYDWFEDDPDDPGPFVSHFLGDVLSNGGCPYFDVMNFHAYPAYADTWATYGPGLRQKAAAIESVVLTYCQQAKSIIVTETGWHSNATPGWPDTTEETQANYVVQLGTQSLAAGLDMMIWWTFSDVGFPYPFNTGLLTYYGNTKPAFTAYTVLVAELGHADYVRVLSSGETGAPDLEVYQFNRDGQTIYVAWLNPINTAQVKTLSLPASQATIRTLYNITSQINDGDDGAVDGRIHLSVGGAPLYVEITP